MSPPRRHPIRAGITREAAIDWLVFLSNRRGRVLFMTDGWFKPHRARLLDLLPPVLDDDHAAGLLAVLYKQREMHQFMTWLEAQPWPWTDVDTLLSEFARIRLEKRREEGFFPWEDVEACRGCTSRPSSFGGETDGHSGPPEDKSQLDGCHGCGRTAEQLEWIYFQSPAWTWQEHCGRAGWMGICAYCRFQIHCYIDVMS